MTNIRFYIPLSFILVDIGKWSMAEEIVSHIDLTPPASSTEIKHPNDGSIAEIHPSNEIISPPSHPMPNERVVVDDALYNQQNPSPPPEAHDMINHISNPQDPLHILSTLQRSTANPFASPDMLSGSHTLPPQSPFGNMEALPISPTEQPLQPQPFEQTDIPIAIKTNGHPLPLGSMEISATDSNQHLIISPQNGHTSIVPLNMATKAPNSIPDNILKTIAEVRANRNMDADVKTYRPSGKEGAGNIEFHLSQKDDLNCTAHEIYIIDGERTLLLTNKKLTANIETMQDKTLNHQALIENQNKIIYQLKQRLANSEAQVDDSLGLLIKHEKSYQKLLRELNKTKSIEGDTRRRNEFLEKQMIKEKEERSHYEQLSEHFKQEMDRANEKLNAIKIHSNKGCDQSVDELQKKHSLCIKELDEQRSTIQGLYHEQTLIKDNLGVFNRTRTHYSKRKCRIMKKQLFAQDNALILLKNEVQNQAHTLESMNRLISMKHDTIENIHNAVTIQLEQQKNAEVEYKARDELLLSQQETIRLLQQLKDENDYLRRAREIALGILQGTVYRMVNNIDSCKSEAIEGLKARIESLEKSQQPFQDMIKTLKASISQSSKVTQMEQAHNANLKRLLNIRIKTLEVLTQEKQAIDDTAAFCSGKCKFNPEIIKKIDQMYRLPNEHSCKPICKQMKRKHTLGHHEHGSKIEHQVELQEESHRSLSRLENSRLHSRKKLPSFMATKQEDKILPFK